MCYRSLAGLRRRAAGGALFVRLSLANACDVSRKRTSDDAASISSGCPQPGQLKHQLKRSKDMASHERQVTLHIYTFAGVGGRTNSILSSLSLGLHHSGVMSGREFSFNGGVFRTRPHECTRGMSRSAC